MTSPATSERKDRMETPKGKIERKDRAERSSGKTEWISRLEQATGASTVSPSSPLDSRFKI